MAYLDTKEFKRMKELQSKKDRTAEENAELLALIAKKGAKNDPEDYLPSDNLKKDLATFYQKQLAGQTVVSSNMAIIPGMIAILDYHKVVDSVKSPTSGISLAARDFYQYIRSGQSGSTNYQGVDIQMFISAAAEIADLTEWLKMIYRLANTYDNLNVSWPSKIFQAYFGNTNILDGIVDDPSHFRGKVNMLVRMLSSFNFPADLPFMRVRRHLIANVFTDDPDNSRAQLYMYRPASYLVYNQTKYITGGCLERKLFPQFSTYQDLLTFMDTIKSMVAALKADSVITTMNGDIYRKYEKENKLDLLYKFEELNSLEVIKPLYDKHILERIRNTVAPQDLAYGDIVQADNCIWSVITPKSPRIGQSGSQSVFLVDHWNGATEGQNVIYFNTAGPGTQQGTVGSPGSWDKLIADSNECYAKYFTIPSYHGLLTSKITNYEEYPDVDMNIESTRHIVFVNGVHKSQTQIAPAEVTGGTASYVGLWDYLTHGSEIVCQVNFYDSNLNKSIVASFTAPYLNNNFSSTNAAVVASFKYHPIFLIGTAGQAGATNNFPGTISSCITDFDEYGTLEFATLKPLNEQALITEFSSSTISAMLTKGKTA